MERMERGRSEIRSSKETNVSNYTPKRSQSYRILSGKLVDGFSSSDQPTFSQGSTTSIVRKDGSRQSLADFETSLVQSYKSKHKF